MKVNLTTSLFQLSLGVLLIIISSCKEEQKAIHAIEIKFEKEGELRLFKSNSDSLITTFNIEIADNDYETQTGLMHRQSMRNDNAMLFIFPDMKIRSFYMKNTYIPLDIIYLNEDKIIVSIQDNAKPLDDTSLPSQFPAKYVLEINAGLSKKWGLEIGSKMEFSKLSSN